MGGVGRVGPAHDSAAAAVAAASGPVAQPAPPSFPLFCARVFEQRRTRFSTSDSVRRARPRLLEDSRVLDRTGGPRVLHRGRRTRATQNQACRARSS